MLRFVTVIGARPQFIKAAVVSRLARGEYADRVEELLVHTGQHYDENMSEIFFRELEIPEPDVNLGVGSASHGRQTGEMLGRIEDVLLDSRPDWVLVYGDTNSTLAGSLAASKLQIPVAHVEAGLRSHWRAMPEEQNRIVADHLSDLLLCPTARAVQNLRDEGIRSEVRLVGDVMYDATLYYGNGWRSPRSDAYALLTLHRAENVDDETRFREICRGVSELPLPVLFPAHPRTRQALERWAIQLGPRVEQMQPVGFAEMQALEQGAQAIITDSGGVQKEAYFHGVPCLTVRDQTEWIETVEAGWNTLVPAEAEALVAAFAELATPEERPSLFGAGHAGQGVLDAILHTNAERES